MGTVCADDVVGRDDFVAGAYARNPAAVMNQRGDLYAITKSDTEGPRAIDEKLIEVSAQQHNRRLTSPQAQRAPAWSRQEQRVDGVGPCPDRILDSQVGEDLQSERGDRRAARFLSRKTRAIEKDDVLKSAPGKRDCGGTPARSGADDDNPVSHDVGARESADRVLCLPTDRIQSGAL